MDGLEATLVRLRVWVLTNKHTVRNISLGLTAFTLVYIVSGLFAPRKTDFGPHQIFIDVTSAPDGSDITTFYNKLDRRQISPWHNISIADPRLTSTSSHGRVVNFVVEIPRGVRTKIEISKDLPGNPMVQDRHKKDGSLRSYAMDSLVNYGSIPQTWEDPAVLDPPDGLAGDGDPLDAMDISMNKHEVGDVYPVRVLGLLGMVDQGEADWKIVVVDMADPLAASLADDLNTRLDAIRTWFRTYKVPEGKPENTFTYNGEYMSSKYAWDVIQATHAQWRRQFDPSGPPRLPGLEPY